MDVRDAAETDASDLADLLDTPVGVAERLLRERAVTVAEQDRTVVGVVAYEVSDGAVHVTRLTGDPDAVSRLLDEPLAFADAEDLPVKLFVTESEGDVRRAVETKGFQEVGAGPTLDGEPTKKYQY